MNYSISIDNLAVEVTRRCNFSCSHCLRGDAELVDLDMSRAGIFLEQVSRIGCLTITGGEPALVPGLVAELLRLCKVHEVEVNSFYIATNGSCISEEFVVACLRWYAYCDDNEMSQVLVSNDMWHQAEDGYNTDLLDGLSFFSRRHPDEGGVYNLINEGRAGSRQLITEQLELDHYPESKVIEVQEPVIYLNALGNVIRGGDWSYESQKQLVYCGASEFTDMLVEEANSIIR